MRRTFLHLLLFVLVLFGESDSYAQTALPYSIDFGTSQEGWSVVDNSTTPGTTWKYEPKYAYIQGKNYGSVVLRQDYYSECNDYYISPGFSLQKGKLYTAEFNAFNEVNGEGYALSFKCGTSKDDVTKFTTKFMDIVLDDNSEYPAAQKVQFGVPSDGIYYFAFHNTSPQFNYPVFLFEFRLYEGDDSGETPDDVVVATPYNVDLRTDYADWKAADNNSDGKTWMPISGFGPMLGMALSQQHDDDYFSPKVTLRKGQTYRITTNVVVEGTPKGFDVVTLTCGEDKSNMTPIRQLELANSGENVQYDFFTPKSDGDYYFSFHNTSTGGGNPLYIYGFAVEEYSEEIPEEKEIFSTDFSGTDPLNGWRIVDGNNDGTSWQMINGYTGPVYDGNMAVSAADDWLMTPGINLVAGKDYLVRYTISQAGAFEADTYEVKYGTEQSVAGMTQSLVSESVNLSSGTVEKVVRLVCGASGNNYVGFRLTTANQNGIVSIEKFAVFEVGKAKPKAVEHLTGVSDFNEKSVTLQWHNPIYDTSDAPIIGNLNINIYENGVKVATLENREAGAEDSYSYSPENFGGIVSYQISASIDGIESLPSEISLNLDDVQGESVLLQNFPLTNNSDFEKWKIENLNGGTTWNYYSWNQYIYMEKNCREEHNDWAITPGVELEPGKRYVVNFEVSTSMYYPGNLKVWIGDAQTNTSMTKELVSLEDICYNGFTRTVSPQFSVETAGTYYIGFQAGKAENGMNLKNVNIRYISTEEVETQTFEVPYTQMFDDSTETPEGWKIVRGSDEFGFYVMNVVENAPILMNAPSQPNALLAKNGAPAGRKEIVYTPKFFFKAGKTYDISFLLQMFQQSCNNVVTLYKATEQREDAIVGEALLETNENTMFDWKEQKVTISVVEDVEYTFVIKLTNDFDNGDAVMIDDFKVVEGQPVEPVEPVTPASVKNLSVINNGSNKITLTWNQPMVDTEGKAVMAGSVIKTKIFDGTEQIGETELVVDESSSLEQNGVPMSFQYIYDINEFVGQKTFKCVPYIEDLEGEATSTIVLISSLSKGYLKECVYSFDFLDGLSDWEVFDVDKDGNTWKHEDSFAVVNGSDEWIVSQETSLNPEKSYYVVCELLTDTEQSVNITFTRGEGQSPEEQTETLCRYENVMLGRMAAFEIGGAFNPGYETNCFGIHVENENNAKVQIKSFKIMRLFTMDEPEPLPYVENFENQDRINDATNFTNKWGRRTSTSQLFNVANMAGSPVTAHSGEYALLANEFDLNGREEILFTPYFTLEKGKSYEVSFYLYMPGNGNNITTGQVLAAYTQDESGLPLPVILNMPEPVKEWTQFKAHYTPEYDMDYCFYFKFYADAANAGMIAFDDFKIEEVSGSGISQAENVRMYYVHSSSTLYLPEYVESVSVFDMQGQMVLNMDNVSGQVQMSGLYNGIYVVKALTNEGKAIYLKINK